MRKNSIRSRIQRSLIPLLLLLWIVASVGVYFGVRNELRDALMAQSDVLASVIARVNMDEIDPSTFHPGLERYVDDYVIQIWDADWTLKYKSQTILADGSTAFPNSETGFGLVGDWKQFVYRTKGGDHILVASLKEETNELIWLVSAVSTLPLALVLIGSVLAVLFFVRQGLSPLIVLSRDLRRRSANDLTDLPSKDQPEELMPIVSSLNELFSRVRNFLERERQFVDDAAHELRTPLTVIKAQCQAINTDVLDEETRARFANVVAGVDRMTDLNGRLLQQAKAEQPEAEAEPVDIARILRATIADLVIDAEAKRVDIKFACNSEPQWVAVPSDLEIIFRNLIENAIKFSSRPGNVQVRLSDEMVEVEDDGPGIPLDFRSKIFDRFFRISNGSSQGTQTGTGLGLSITKALVLRSGLKIEVLDGSELPGARFRVHL